MNKLLMILALTMSFAALADDKDKDSAYHLGDEVRAWTDLQKNDVATDRVVQPMPGEIADKVYDRYLKTFDYPIPKTFDRESFASGSGSGGSSAQ
jgi:hypothetical protein